MSEATFGTTETFEGILVLVLDPVVSIFHLVLDLGPVDVGVFGLVLVLFLVLADFFGAFNGFLGLVLEPVVSILHSTSFPVPLVFFVEVDFGFCETELAFFFVSDLVLFFVAIFFPFYCSE